MMKRCVQTAFLVGVASNVTAHVMLRSFLMHLIETEGGFWRQCGIADVISVARSIHET